MNEQMSDPGIFVGKGENPVSLTLKYANRHGLICGATGTGKTVTLQILAEGFSDAGVPVFISDVKGDVAGLSQAGTMKGFLQERAETIGLEPYDMKGYPTVLWDLFGKQGHPVRATITDMGPLLLARLLGLNDTQEGVLVLAFRVADDEGMLLLDLKDLRALLINISDRRQELQAKYGNVSPSSIGAIQRKLLALEEQGADQFFAEPALDLNDFMRTAEDGRGIINVLAADKLMMSPKLYATFLLWMLSELFEMLPEAGDPDKPKLVFFFDEAHLLFEDCPPALLDKVETVVRLIRSKGVGVYFVTQNPMDVPDSVSSQLGNRIQHALRAFTPKERKVIRAAAETFRPNPAFETIDVITELGIGEALVSTLMSKGVPGVVERTLIRPPSSRMGPLTAAERKKTIGASPVAGTYDKTVDNRSAYEILGERAEKAAAEARKQAEREAKQAEKAKKAKTSGSSSAKPRSRSRRQSTTQAVLKQVARTATNRIVSSLMRGILGSLKR
ncbi:DUF853 family protein [Parvularcula flava]|uniref:DUF853 family protein n=1 Tax=Aquisalinus luteolus TaxID=1566827 RepID=A0A8J3A215_9PROT|nr:helicase HerA-like domain-containing protein [Aquisalinus luteolus]NHK26659.1 DUF853 family protein [Aquisalinus luteolus]GGH93015.1 hypothetical protein GCM10011355_03860 [Aquisalinus luteolus]